MIKNVVIILAAGVSERFGDKNKLLFKIRRLPIIERSIEIFSNHHSTAVIIVVVPKINIEKFHYLKTKYTKVIEVISGGDTRQASTKNGINYIIEKSIDADIISIHDGARPKITPNLLTRTISAAMEFGAAIPSIKPTDSLHLIDKQNFIEHVLDRDSVVMAQTPQIFKPEVIFEVFANGLSKTEFTDEAGLASKKGFLVKVVSGSRNNIKITYKEDTELLSRLSGSIRHVHGIGFDVHKLEVGNSLKLGGVEIQDGFSLIAHSDGDVLLHAISSAILGAAKLGDLGSNFPNIDKWFKKDSSVILEECLKLADKEGWTMVSLDSIVIAQRPRLAPYQKEIESKLTQLTDLDEGAVNVKITSTDEVGFIGKAEGIAAQAVVDMCERWKP